MQTIYSTYRPNYSTLAQQSVKNSWCVLGHSYDAMSGDVKGFGGAIKNSKFLVS